jgi:CRISPR system Cascade subunit CasD
MKEYLIFHLYGSLSSFGDTAVGEYRPVYGHPSKSGIVGFVAASLGISREREDEIMQLSNDLHYAVLIVSSGMLMRDYHTTQVPSASSIKRQPAATRRDELNHRKVNDVNTILSFRDYHMDSYYRIALWSGNGTVDLTKIEEGLRFPHYTPYLGRKSCPLAVPVQPVIVSASGVQKAFQQYPNTLDELLKGMLPVTKSQNNDRYTIVTDDEQEIEDNVGTRINWRKDRLISRKNWQYGDRKEYVLSVEGRDVF